MSDSLDRPGTAFTAGAYADSGTCEDRHGQRGKYTAAGVGYARAEWSLCDAEAKGPNAGTGYTISDESGARAFAKAELGSVSATAGPVKATVGLAADTGIGVGPSGVEAKVLGTGVKLGRTVGFSVLGSGFEFKLW